MRRRRRSGRIRALGLFPRGGVRLSFPAIEGQADRRILAEVGRFPDEKTPQFTPVTHLVTFQGRFHAETAISPEEKRSNLSAIRKYRLSHLT